MASFNLCRQMFAIGGVTAIPFIFVQNKNKVLYCTKEGKKKPHNQITSWFILQVSYVQNDCPSPANSIKKEKQWHLPRNIF